MRTSELDLKGPAWKKLFLLFAGYINEDFVDDYGTAWTAARTFKAENPEDSVLLAADQALALLDAVEDDDELWAAMLELGLGYAPEAEGWSNRAWLEEMQAFLRSSAR